jgi:arginine-tRNA-protein transferase
LIDRFDYHVSMRSLYTFTTPASSCAYLPDQSSRLEYEIVGEITEVEYERRLEQGWRRFGFALFHPKCLRCQACQSLRVPVKTFHPNRSQRRAWAANEDLTVAICTPEVTDEKLELHYRFHAFQVQNRGWPEHGPIGEASYGESFVDNPFPTQEWCYFKDGKLLGVGYVDRLSIAMSAIYFFYDPAERHRSLGTYNVLRVLAEAQSAGIHYLYLGYFVEGCQSLEYKSNFRPNEVMGMPGDWGAFRL